MEIIRKDRTCKYCGIVIFNSTPLEMAQHTRTCPKRKKIKVNPVFYKVTVADIENPHPNTDTRAIRLKCLDCCVGSSYEVERCPVEECPLWSRRFGKRPNTAFKQGRKVAENESEPL